jgi:hypothetical protein
MVFHDCSFMMIALLLSQGTQVCARKHQRRHSDFRRGRRLGKYDHIIVWTRPPRPDWMDEETYAQEKKTGQVRLFGTRFLRCGMALGPSKQQEKTNVSVFRSALLSLWRRAATFRIPGFDYDSDALIIGPFSIFGNINLTLAKKVVNQQ